LAGLTAAVGLGLAGLIHGVWARGSTWPAQSQDELADLVVGQRPMPGPAACAAVATALGGAATATATAALAGSTGGPVVALAGRTAAVTGGALLLRGGGGLAVGSLGLGTVTDTFRRWDLRLYSPLCLLLGALTLAGTRRPAGAARSGNHR
jgi:hypothetical protein